MLLIFAFYYYLQRADKMTVPQRMMDLLLIMLAYWPVYLLGMAQFGSWQAWTEQFWLRLPWFVMHLLMIVPLAFYNSELGHRGKVFDFTYSWFYPVHFVVLGLIRFLFIS